MRSPPTAPRDRRHLPPHPMRCAPVEVHVLGCDCAACEPYVAGAAPQLTGREIAKLLGAGLVAGHALALAYDPAGTAAIVVDIVCWWFL